MYIHTLCLCTYICMYSVCIYTYMHVYVYIHIYTHRPLRPMCGARGPGAGAGRAAGLAPAGQVHDIISYYISYICMYIHK